MGHLFLDIETYAAKDMKETALNPYLPGSKVLFIAYNYYEGDKPPVKKSIKKPEYLAEWQGGEKKMLLTFLSMMQRLQRKDKNLKIHGFNILHFDLPYLFGRMRSHKIADEQKIYDILFNTVGFDMMQLGSMLSDKERRREALWGLNEQEVNKFFGIQTVEGTDTDCSRLYDSGKKGEIIEKCLAEFNYEQMLNSFYLYVQELSEGGQN